MIGVPALIMAGPSLTTHESHVQVSAVPIELSSSQEDDADDDADDSSDAAPKKPGRGAQRLHVVPL